MIPTTALLLLLSMALHLLPPTASETLGLRMLHRFSHEFHQAWSKKHSLGQMYGNWASSPTPDFYRLLHRQDSLRLRRSRSRILRTDDQLVSFASGNQTTDYGEMLGWLHYAVIDIGTPNTSFLVALDSGSDLFWVPCECKQCASISTSSQQLDVPLNVYNPSASKTSKRVTCFSDLCDTSKTCGSQNNECLYNVRYVSDNTSTSGMLVEDVIHLASGRIHGSPIETPVVFGCGQVQSGNFLNGGAPDGLLGLGFGPISLPNSLAKAGLVQNSFSMCFQADGSGRIFFGDKGLESQQTTPFISNLQYAIGILQISVGQKSFDQKGLPIIVDTGTSFTYLPKEVYSAVTTEFDQQIQQQRTTFADVPWHFCYAASNDNIETPAVSMVFNGGGNFSIFSPLIGIYNAKGTMDGFCLAILPSDIAILGQSFMTGYQLVFDREEMKLGWSPSDCYKLGESITVNATSPSSSLPPIVLPDTSSFSPAPSPNDSNRVASSVKSNVESLMAFHSPYHALLTIIFSSVVQFMFQSPLSGSHIS